MEATRIQNFAQLPTLPWHTYIKGTGVLEPTGKSLRFVKTDTSATQYTNAQIDDYQALPRRQFLWRPPLRLQVHARFSHPTGILRGTAGFGFWNDPFMMTGFRWPTLPKAVWFFYASPPSNMKLAQTTPGYGWKAATIDAGRWPFFALLPTVPLAIPLMRITALYRLCWPIAQRAIHVNEAIIKCPMTDWHSYDLDWQEDTVRFSVAGQTVLACSTSPRGPLGLVVWFDNQYMVVTPWGNFKSGLLANTGTEWMEIDAVNIETASNVYLSAE